MPSISGKGISQAVRDSISSWVTPAIASELYDVYRRERPSSSPLLSLAAFTWRIQVPEQWVRRTRVNNRRNPGFIRTYTCKLFPEGTIGMTVYTNAQDTIITYMTFRVYDRLIGGHVLSVPSRLAPAASRATTTSRTSPTPTPPADIPLVFRPFTAEELDHMESIPDYVNSAAFTRLFELE